MDGYRQATQGDLPVWMHTCGRIEAMTDEYRRTEVQGGCDACESGDDDPEAWRPLYELVGSVQQTFAGTVLLIVAVDDRGDVVALDPRAGARLATETVYGTAPIARRVAAELAVHRAFDALDARRGDGEE